jgi:hypothetical protein
MLDFTILIWDTCKLEGVSGKEYEGGMAERVIVGFCTTQKRNRRSKIVAHRASPFVRFMSVYVSGKEFF